jgi:guanylate kinase
VAARLRHLLAILIVKRGLLIVISGPSGVGKDTIIKRLLQQEPNLVYSVSGTTRKPRPGEKPDENYTFLTRDQFLSLVDQGAFLEHADYNGHLYGTFRDRVEKARAGGRDVVLKIDVQGAEQVRGQMPDAISIFVVAPSEEELEHRLEERGSESADDMASRREIAKQEMKLANHYEHVVVNDDVERAVGEIRQIIDKVRRRVT